MGGSCTSCHTSKDVTTDSGALGPLGKKSSPSGAGNLELIDWMSPMGPAPAPAPMPASSQAALAALAPKDKDPAPGPGVMEFGTPRVGDFKLSPDKAFTRLTVARLIGKAGFDEVRTAAAVVDAIGEMREQPKTRALARLMGEQIDELHAAWTAFSANVRNAGIARLKVRNRFKGRLGKKNGASRRWIRAVAEVCKANRRRRRARRLRRLRRLTSGAQSESRRAEPPGPRCALDELK